MAHIVVPAGFCVDAVSVDSLSPQKDGKMNRLLLRAAAAAVALGSALGARADIVSFGGSVAVQTPPADIGIDQWESDTEARAWFERSLTLSAPLTLDAINTGLVSNTGDPVPGQVDAGTTITSYMLRVDPVGNTHVSLTGYLQFDQPILGVLFLRSSLNGSDSLLGRDGLLYNQNPQRSVDLSDTTDPDSFTISSDRLRLDFSFGVGGWTDDIRIVTAVPCPGGAAVGIVAGLATARRRRRTVLT